MIHELKIFPEFFEAIVSGNKTFDVRLDDRGYMVGDYLALNEHEDKGSFVVYTGRSCVVYVDYILSDKRFVKDGYVIMSIKPCSVSRISSDRREPWGEREFTVPVLKQELDDKND